MIAAGIWLLITMVVVIVGDPSPSGIAFMILGCIVLFAFARPYGGNV